MSSFSPQPLAELKARYKQALERSYSEEEILKDPSQAPGNKKENTFDFAQGIRLIISRDKVEGNEVIHFSGSVDAFLFEMKGKSQFDVLNLMVNLFCELSEYATDKIMFTGLSPVKGVPHWYVIYANLN